MLDAQLEQAAEMGGKVEEGHLRMGRPAEEILRLSEEIVAGLIIVGNQGLRKRHPLRPLLRNGRSQSPLRPSLDVTRQDYRPCYHGCGDTPPGSRGGF